MESPAYILNTNRWRESLETEKIPNKKEVLSYLRQFKAAAHTSPYIFDPFTKETVQLSEMGAFTDGTWCWDSEIIYFFEKYNAPLSPSFLEAILNLPKK